MEQLATLLLMVMKGSCESKENDSVVADCMLREEVVKGQIFWVCKGTGLPIIWGKIHLVAEGSLFYCVSLYREEEGNTVTQCLRVWFFTPPSRGVWRETLWAAETAIGVISDYMREVSLLQKAAGSNPGQGIYSLLRWNHCISDWAVGGLDRRWVDDHLKRNSTGQWHDDIDAA